jgi:hypothetical protein
VKSRIAGAGFEPAAYVRIPVKSAYGFEVGFRAKTIGKKLLN